MKFVSPRLWSLILLFSFLTISMSGTLGLWCLSPEHFLKDRELHSDPLDARRWKETASNPTEVEGGGGGFAPETEF